MTDEDEHDAGTPSPTSATDGAADDGEEWRFDPADFDDAEPAAAAAAEGEPDDGDADEDGNVAGSLLDLEEEIEPGTPTLEGTVFVVLGALTTVLFLLSAAGAL
jgi:hypothetical protein